MRSKSSNKILLVILSFVVVFSIILSACTSNSGSNKDSKPSNSGAEAKNSILNTAGDVPITNKQVTLSVMTPRTELSGPSDKMWFYKWMREKANVDLKVTEIDLPAWKERKNIMFASGELPDFFLGSDFSTDEITRYGQIGKELMPLNDLIEKYAPHIRQLFKDYPKVKAAVTSPDGNIYTLPRFYKDPGVNINFQRPWIHASWLKKLNLQTPTTLDELYNVLKAFKDQDPDGDGKADTIPFSGSWNENYAERTIFLSAFGFPVDSNMTLTVKNGKVVLPEANPVYADYLKFMNKLFTEGLMDKDIFTQTQVQARAKSAEGKVGLLLDGAPFVLDPSHWKEYEAFTPVKSKWSNEPVWPAGNSVEVGRFAISSKAKNPEVAIRIADLYFTGKYAVYFFAGPPNGSEDALGYPSWYVKDGKVTYDLPKGFTGNWQYINTLNPLSSTPGVNVNEVNSPYYESVFGKKLVPDPEDQDTAWRLSIMKNTYPYLKERFPPVFLDETQTERINELKTPIEDYTKMMEVQFITGHQQLTDENLAKYYQQLKSLGVDEYVEIYQKAYNQYLANIK